MKKSLYVALALILSIFSANAHAEEPTVNGYLHEIDGQRILHLWGDHYEMGYAHGYLLGEEIIQVMHEYVLFLVPPVLYSAAHFAASLLFAMPEEYREEVQAMVDGIIDSGADPYIEPLGRNINADDLMMCNAIGDIGAMACSCQMAWGPGTEDDPALAGQVAVVRNLDWTMTGPDRFLLPEKSILIVFTDTDPDQQAVAMYSFPGFFGCLSCMNEQGTTAVVNIAHNGIPLWDINFIHRYVPMGITLRQALAAKDFNQDGQGDMYDLIDNIALNYPSGAIAINLAQASAASGGDPAVIVETDSDGMLLRTPGDEPGWYDDILLSTNHLSKLRADKKCRRLRTMHDEITSLDGRLTLDEMWRIERMVQQDYFLSSTVQTIYFLPDSREIGMAYTSHDAFSADKSPTVLSWQEATELPDDVDLSDDDESPDESPADDDDDSDNGCGW